MPSGKQTATLSDGLAVELLLRFTRSAHEAGYPASELELRIMDLAKILGLRTVEVSATPTVINLTLGCIPNQQVYVLRVQPYPVDLHAISRLDEIARLIASGQLDCRRALEEIEQLGRHRLNRSSWLEVGAHGLASAGLVPILGGGWRESLGAAIVGMIIGSITQVVVRYDRSAALVAPLAAFLASFLASVFAKAGWDIATADVTYSALFVFLPGVLMATGVRELATGHLQAGLSNSANALVQLVGLVFGVAVGRSLAVTWLGVLPSNTPDPLPRGLDIVAAAFVGIALVVILRARTRDAVWTCSAAVLAIAANLVTTQYLGNLTGTIVAAFVIGLVGNGIARRLYRSPLVFIVPGVLILVPGSVGYQSASSLLDGQIDTGIDRAFDTLVSFLAKSYGLVASTLMLPDRTAASDCDRTQGAAQR